MFMLTFGLEWINALVQMSCGNRKISIKRRLKYENSWIAVELKERRICSPMENRLAPWRFKVRSKQYSQRYRHTTCRVGRVRWLMLIIHGSMRYRWNEFQLWIANLNIKPCKANVNNVGTVSGATANIYVFT